MPARRIPIFLVLLLLVAAAVAAAVRSGENPEVSTAQGEAALTRAVLGAVVDHGMQLLEDPDLAAAAREHSVVLSAGARFDTHTFLRQALSAHRVLDPFPYVFYGSGPPSGRREIESRLLARLRALPAEERRLYTHVGVGIHAREKRTLWQRRTEWFVTVLLTQRAVSFTTLPGDLRPGDRVLFEGEIHPPFRDVEILLTRPDGNTDVLENFASEPTAFRTYVHFNEPDGEYQLEVLGHYDMGPRVLGLFSLYPRRPGQELPYERLLAGARTGSLEPSRSLPGMPSPASEYEAEAVLLRLVNRDRAQAGLPALEADDDLAAVARAHSRDMRDHDYFAHVSPRTGRLSDRAEAAQLPYRRLGENIAVGQTVHEAEEALMRSPGHRMNLLDPEFTHIGVGVAFDYDRSGTRRVFVTQNFMLPRSP